MNKIKNNDIGKEGNILEVKTLSNLIMAVLLSLR